MMKRIGSAFVGLAMILFTGCSTSGTGATAPSTNPDKPNAARKLTVKVPVEKTIKQNGTVDVDISISRDHFAGPVDIEIRHLPAGVSVVTPDLTIPAGKDSVKATLRAAADAKVVVDAKFQVAAKAKEQKDMPEDVQDVKIEVKAKD
jgi:hypothetical protein